MDERDSGCVFSRTEQVLAKLLSAQQDGWAPTRALGSTILRFGRTENGIKGAGKDIQRRPRELKNTLKGANFPIYRVPEKMIQTELEYRRCCIGSLFGDPKIRSYGMLDLVVPRKIA